MRIGWLCCVQVHSWFRLSRSASSRCSRREMAWPPQTSHQHHLNECSPRVISLNINYFLIWVRRQIKGSLLSNIKHNMEERWPLIMFVVKGFVSKNHMKVSLSSSVTYLWTNQSTGGERQLMRLSRDRRSQLLLLDWAPVNTLHCQRWFENNGQNSSLIVD